MGEDLDCNKCSLRKSCGQVVWGLGHASSRIMLVGEYPDAESDLMGEPFVGRGGVHLKRLLKKADIDEEDTYLTYAAKCMPKKKDEPTDDQLNACRGHLWAEIKAVRAKVIVTLGALPTSLLLKLPKSFKMADIVGKFQVVPYTSAVIVPWYSTNHLLQRGRDVDVETIKFFRKVALRVHEMVEKQG